MLDTPRKFQDDFERIDPVDIVIKKSKADDDQKQVNTRKDDDIDVAKLKDLQKKDNIF